MSDRISELEQQLKSISAELREISNKSHPRHKNYLTAAADKVDAAHLKLDIVQSIEIPDED